MKPARFTSLATPIIAAIWILIAVFPGTPRAAAGQDKISRRDVRAARTAVEEGRWSEGLEIYEKVLGSPLALDPELRSEALFSTALILLSSEAGTEVRSTAQERLVTLAARLGHGKALEIKALTSLLGALEDEQSSTAELSEILARERLTMDEERQDAARSLALKNDALDEQKQINRDLNEYTRTQIGEIRALEQEVENRDAALAQCDTDVDFLTTQLQGTHQDQTQLLAAVINKNEDLRSKERQLQTTRIALEQREKELEEQAAELSEKEAELQRREAAIREVTERILAKDQPDS